MARFKRNRVQQRQDGEVRRSQMVTTYGPGSMMDLLHQAVLVGGLDFWSWGYREKKLVPERRLRMNLAPQFEKLGQPLDQDKPFFEPPTAGDEPSRLVGVQVLEFPQWFVCQNPECRALLGKEGLDLKSDRYFHACLRPEKGKRKGSETVPVRFLGACRHGHVQEFPWVSFVHMGRPRCGSPQLSLQEGATGDFSEIEIHCQCGASNRLSTVGAKGLQLRCDGLRPWLGPEATEPDCDEGLRLLVRTASNSYFAQQVSAVSIPEPGGELREKIEAVWDIVKNATAETLPAFRTIPRVQVALADYADGDVLAAVRTRKEGKAVAQAHLRTAEFQQLVSSPDEVPGELPDAEGYFFARQVKTEGGLPAGVERVVLASKLREVRVQVGFTRLESVTPDMQGEYDLGVQTQRLGLTTNWLPATEVRGEGVFIQLSEEAVQKWEEKGAVKERADELLHGYEMWSRTVKYAPPFPGVRFYMLHSLAHLLATAISLECGYSSSAIRERIYCGPSAKDPTPMAAILLMTGSTGTEGTLGGLVEQGRKLRAHLQHAYDLGTLCSNDPVCAGHSPFEDPAERWLEGAACHGCLFIAECSCERFNRYLDRSLVVPTVGPHSGRAFFSERP
jgi:hypothetical protein